MSYDGRRSVRSRTSDADAAGKAPGKSTLTGKIQRKASAAPRAGVDEQVAGAGTSPGVGLPTGLRAQLEAATGADLDRVRVHDGAASAQASAALGAHAWTLGTDVHFADGAYAPGTAAGDHLIAHEVAHVVQQQGGADAQPRAKPAISTPGDALEVEADRFADAFAAGATAPIAGRADGVVHREEDEPVTLEARAAAADERGARRLARELIRDQLETPGEVARLGALVPAAPRVAFWDEAADRLARALSGRIGGRVPAALTTEDAVRAWIEPWAQLVAAWLEHLPEDARAQVRGAAMARLESIVRHFKGPNRDTFATQEPLRDGVYAGVTPHLGADALEAAHHTGPAPGSDPAAHEGERDIWMADETRRETARETALAAEPFFDRAEVERAAAAMEHIADSLLGVDPAAPDHPALVRAYADALMAYKRLLRLGTGSATEADLALLQDHAAVLDAHVVMVNRAETDRQAAIIEGGTVPGGRTQERGDVEHAGWWNPLMVPGLPIERRPQLMTLNEGRRAADITQVGLHEGGRTVGGTTKTFLDDPRSAVNDAAESHFCVNPDGSVGQLAPVSERGAHIVSGNAASVGIDLTFYDGAWAGETAAQDYMAFLAESPAQIVAAAKLSLATGDLSGQAFPLAPPIDDFTTKTAATLDASGPGIYPHGPMLANGHHDPGDEITQEMYKWVVVVQVWEEHFGPVNVRDEGELARMEALVRRADQHALVALADDALLAAAAGRVAVDTGTADYTVTITPAAGAPTEQALPRRTARGALQLAVADGDVVTAGQPLARVNPYDDAQRGRFDAQVRGLIAALGT